MKHILNLRLGKHLRPSGLTDPRLLVSLYTSYRAASFWHTGQLYMGYAGLMARWSIFNVNFWWMHFKK